MDIVDLAKTLYTCVTGVEYYREEYGPLFTSNLLLNEIVNKGLNEKEYPDFNVIKIISLLENI